MVSIFNLALETRRQIYQLLIVYPKPVNQWYQAKPSDLHEIHHNFSALSQSCHQIHDEVRHTFYNKKVFSFQFNQWLEREPRALSQTGFAHTSQSLPVPVTAPELRFLQFWRDPSVGGADLAISQITECRVSIITSTTFRGDMKIHGYGQTLCTWLAKARQIRRLQVYFQVAHRNIQDERRPPDDLIFRVTGSQHDLKQFIGLGLLAPFGQLTNVEKFELQGDIPAVYRTNLLRKMRGHEPTWPLLDMYHALQLYVSSYSNSIPAYYSSYSNRIPAYHFKDDLWQISRALGFAKAGDMKSFKRHRRMVKELGDLQGLDSAILYANDPKQTTTDACD